MLKNPQTPANNKKPLQKKIPTKEMLPKENQVINPLLPG